MDISDRSSNRLEAASHLARRRSSNRKKLEEDPAEPAYLLTDSHIGYRFAEAKLEAVEEKP
jgi:hypothetical protein